MTARCVREEECALVAIAEPPPGLLRRWLRLSFGSPASVAMLTLEAPVISVR